MFLNNIAQFKFKTLLLAETFAWRSSNFHYSEIRVKTSIDIFPMLLVCSSAEDRGTWHFQTLVQASVSLGTFLMYHL